MIQLLVTSSGMHLGKQRGHKGRSVGRPGNRNSTASPARSAQPSPTHPQRLQTSL